MKLLDAFKGVVLGVLRIERDNDTIWRTLTLVNEELKDWPVEHARRLRVIESRLADLVDAPLEVLRKERDAWRELALARYEYSAAVPNQTRWLAARARLLAAEIDGRALGLDLPCRLVGRSIENDLYGSMIDPCDSRNPK